MINKLIDLTCKIFKNDKIAYLIAGGCTTLVNIAIFWLFETFTAVPYVYSNIISVGCAIIFAFFANKIFVFKSKSDTLFHWLKEFWLFISARLTTMVIEVGGVSLLVEIFGINKMFSKILTQFIVLIINYFISKFLVFNNPKEVKTKE